MARLRSRNSRVLVAVGALALTALGATAGAYLYTDEQERVIGAEATRVGAINELADNLSLTVHSEEAALDDYVLSRSEAALARYEELAAKERALLTELSQRSAGLEKIASTVIDVHTASLHWQTSFAELAVFAVGSRDRVSLERFAADSVDDHVAAEAAVERLEALLQATVADLDERTAAVMVARDLATAVGFAVLTLAFAMALLLVRRYGRVLESDAYQANVLNRFTELSSFAVDDHEVATANLIALGRLANPDAAVTHVLNRSKDRAIPEAVSGKAVADVLPLHTLNRCSGLVRGTIYVTDDMSDEMSVRCPIYPSTTGTLACVPLNSGESVGTVHLYWSRPNAFPLALRANVARVAEHAALAIGNRRLLAALHGQANTDPRTGLANSRSFDKAVEDALASRSGIETLSVLMLDIDHFKSFNDRHGHPAGDEALRAFSRVLGSCMRDGDLAARYGGEEFAVLLPGVDPMSAVAVAERIRSQIESTIISLAPGLTDRITVSIGVAAAPEQGLERVTLLRIADEALYRAKAAGRNRVEYLAGADAAAIASDLAASA